LCAPTTRNNTELDFRLTEFGVAGGNPNIARHRQLAATAQRKAVYHRYHWLRKILHRVKCTPALHDVALFDRSHPAKFVYIGAGNKGFLSRAGDDDYTNLIVSFELLEGNKNLSASSDVQGVKFVWSVHGYDCNGSPLFDENVFKGHSLSPLLLNSRFLFNREDLRNAEGTLQRSSVLSAVNLSLWW